MQVFWLSDTSSFIIDKLNILRTHSSALSKTLYCVPLFLASDSHFHISPTHRRIKCYLFPSTPYDFGAAFAVCLAMGQTNLEFINNWCHKSTLLATYCDPVTWIRAHEIITIKETKTERLKKINRNLVTPSA